MCYICVLFCRFWVCETCWQIISWQEWQEELDCIWVSPMLSIHTQSLIGLFPFFWGFTLLHGLDFLDQFCLCPLDYTWLSDFGVCSFLDNILWPMPKHQIWKWTRLHYSYDSYNQINHIWHRSKKKREFWHPENRN